MRPRALMLLVAVSVLLVAGCHCPCCQRDRPLLRDRIRDDRPVPPPDLRSGSMSTPQTPANGAIPAGNVRPGAYGGVQ